MIRGSLGIQICLHVNLGINLSEPLLFTCVALAAKFSQQDGLAPGGGVRKMEADELGDLRISS